MLNIPVLSRWSADRAEKPKDEGRAVIKLNNNQRKALTEYQRTWVRLALHIMNSYDRSSPVALGITSTGEGEGKSTNALALGSALAQESGSNVLVVECDVENPTLANHLDLDSNPGLLEYAEKSDPIELTLQRTNLANLDVMVAGGSENQENHSDESNQQILRNLRKSLPGIVSVLREYYGYILLDMPPISTNAYAKEMASALDGTFLSVMAGVTPLQGLKQASEDMDKSKLKGVILSGTDSSLPDWITRLLAQ